MVKTKISRFTAMLLSVIMILSSFSILTSLEADAASTNVTVTLSDTNKWAKTVTFYEPYSKKNWTHWQGQMRHTMKITQTGAVAYCIQPGTYMYDFVNKKVPTLSSGHQEAWKSLSSDKRNAIKLVLYFGYPNTNTTLSGTNAEKEIATQLIVWEIVCGYRDPNKYNLTDYRFIKAMCGNDYKQNTGVYKAYKQIESAMLNFNKTMSFTSSTQNTASTYTLNWDGTKYTKTLTDSNGVLSNYTLTCSNSNVKLSKSGNKLTISSTQPITSAVVIKAKTTVSSETNNIITYGHYNSEIQEVIDQTTSGKPDPVFGYLKVKTEGTGSLRVTKEYKDNSGNAVKSTIESFVLNNTKFKIQNSAGKYIKASYSGSGTTYSYTGYGSSASDGTTFTPKDSNDNFFFEVNKLPAGTYTIIEQDISYSGYYAKSSKSVKVAVTANNSGGKKTAAFENRASTLVITKAFVQFNAVTDDDYKNITLQVTQKNAEGKDNKINVVCVDSKNNIYQWVHDKTDSAYSGKTITQNLTFVNPKVHSITVTGLPITNNNNYYYQYTASEVDKGNETGKAISNRYTYNSVTKTFQTGSVQSGKLTNTEKKIGYIEIEKEFKVENTDGTTTAFTGNSSLSLTAAYKDISFIVKNSAGKYVKATYSNGEYSYSSLVSSASDATKFVISNTTTKKVKISNLPFGKYSVTEVVGSNVKGQGFNVKESAVKTTTTSYNVSADKVIGGSVKFVNVKPQYVGLRIYKTFVDSNDENIEVSDKLYRQVEFSVYDEDGKMLITALENNSTGTYHLFQSGTTDSPRTAMSLGTETKTITLTGLEAGKKYTVRESVFGKDLKNICICKSSYTVEGTKTNAAILAEDDSIYQSNTVKMPAGENSIAEIHFENTYKTTELEIYKEFDDDLVERQFAVTTVNYDLYPESDPLYVTSEIVKGADGKVRGVASVKDLPLAYYDAETDSIVKIQYKIEEVETPSYYEIPQAQVIIPADGQKNVTFKNKLKTGGIKVIKKAEVNGSDEIIPLEGIEFKLTNNYNSTVLTAKTDSNGELTFSDLPIAVGMKDSSGNESIRTIRYTVTELAGEKNEKYVLADSQTVTLDYTAEANKRTKTVTVLNTPITGNLYLEKADARTLELLSDAEFTLYQDVNGNGKYDKATDTIATGYTIDSDTYTPHHTLVEVTETSADDDGNTATKGTGRYELYNIEKGKYVLVETKTPVGYVAEQKEFAFEITEDQQTVHIYEKDGKTVIGDGSEDMRNNNVDDGTQADGTLNMEYNGEAAEGIEAQYVYNTPIHGDVYLRKLDETTKEKLSGAKFQIWADTNNNGKPDTKTDESCGIMTEIIKDGNGTGEYEMTDLPYGNYFVMETVAPEGYIRSTKTYGFSITENKARVFVADVESKPIKGNVSVLKIDSLTKEQLKGAEFTVYNDVDKDGIITDGIDTVYSKLTEGSDMKYYLNDLPYGEYVLAETKAPEHYVLDDKPIPFDILEHEKIYGYTKENTPETGTGKFVKVSEDNIVKDVTFHIYGKSNTGIEVDETVVTDETGSVSLSLLTGTYTVEELKVADRYVAPASQTIVIQANKTSEVTFHNILKRGSVTLTKVDEEYPENKLSGAVFEVYNADNTLAGTMKETDKGIYTLGNLAYGNYTLKEITAPVGFNPDKNVYSFEIRNNDEIVAVETEAGKGFINTPIKGTISMLKIDEDTEKPLVSAEFTLYDTQGNVIQTAVTDENGHLEFQKVRYGTYIVKETKAPENYVLDETKIPFQVLENGKVITYTKTNTPQSGSLEIIKESEDGIVENVKFRIYGTSANGEEIDETAVTDKDGKILMENLLIGTYTVEEIEVANRYIIPQSQTIVVSTDETASVTFTNILKRGSVMLTKVDKDYPDNKLSGAVFEIYDADKNPVGIMKEPEGGVYQLDELAYGDYTLKEVKAPTGFRQDENEYPFAVRNNGEVVTVETLAGVGFINDAQKGDLVITKRSSDNKLEGFSFRITGKAVTGQEYDEILTTDAEGRITVKDLRIGTYTVSEISDEATARYDLPDDKTVEITTDNVTEVEMFNDEKVIPFEITKSDISTGELIPDCGFRIRNSAGEIVIEGYTDENGIAKFELVCGDYTYQEFDAPKGYIIDEKEYPFTINPDDTIVKAEMKNTGTGTIIVTKKDISNGVLIPDCGIEILDENMQVIFQGRTDENGEVTFTLPYGKYYYREFDAPKGYILDETPFAFEIKENGEIIKAEMTNKPVEKEITPGYITTDTPKTPGQTTNVPQTGDSTNFLVAVSAVICLIAVSYILYNGRKSNNKKRK